MNTLALKANRNVIKGRIKQKWARFADDDPRYVEGKEEELVGRIQKRRGQSQEEVKRALREDCGWL